MDSPDSFGLNPKCRHSGAFKWGKSNVLLLWNVLAEIMQSLGKHLLASSSTLSSLHLASFGVGMCPGLATVEKIQLFVMESCWLTFWWQSYEDKPERECNRRYWGQPKWSRSYTCIDMWLRYDKLISWLSWQTSCYVFLRTTSSSALWIPSLRAITSQLNPHTRKMGQRIITCTVCQ